MKIALLSNVNLDIVIKNLAKFHDVYETEGYAQWISYALTENKNLKDFEPKMIFLLIDGYALLENSKTYEEGMEEINQAVMIISKFSENYPYSEIAVSTIDIHRNRIGYCESPAMEIAWEASWANEIQKLANSKSNIQIFNLGEIIRLNGAQAFYDEKMWYLGSIPYGIKAMSILAVEIDKLIEKNLSVRKKLLICDLDNTLWGGVIGEDGPEGIVLSESLKGAAFRDTQKKIKQLGEKGILLAIVSKNNPEDVDLAFEKNPYMVLKKDDFVSIKCNWKSKSENIVELADELNLGLSSFVFLDDNPVEREEVRSRLSEVCVANFPKNTAKLPATIDDLYNKYFWSSRQTKEDQEKTQQYKQEAERKRILSQADSMEDYLKSLNICIDLSEVKEEQIERTVQLINKTNQFNTNTLRLDKLEFMQYRENADNSIYVANVADKYGNSGLVVILMLHREKTIAYIDNFLMSCRVMGRQIENAVLTAICDKLQKEGISEVRASYIKTEKNVPVKDLFERLGFEIIMESEEEKRYKLNLPCENTAILSVNWV